MCNILILKPGQMPLERKEFDNMCFNNWHSYGLVTLVDGRMDVVKKVPKSGEIDSQEIWDLLLRDRQYQRFLHVRHNTAGATSVENCHPFDVFYQERTNKHPRHVVFMHNGTLYDYKSKVIVDGKEKDDNDGASDTQNYVNRVLQPYLGATDFGDGRGDISSPFIKALLSKFWPATGNRGLLISSEQEHLLLGTWKTMKAADGSDIISSNDDYFDKVSRGPEFGRRAAEEAARKSQNGGTFQTSTAIGTVTTSQNITPYTAFDFPKAGQQSGRRHGAFELKKSLTGILDDWNVWDRSTAVALGAATLDELSELVQRDPKAAATLMDWIFADYYEMYSELNELDDKHKAATKLVAERTGELNALQEWCEDMNLIEDYKRTRSAFISTGRKGK